MKLSLQVGLLFVVASIQQYPADASSLDSILFKRQTSETEQEPTSSTTKPATDGQQQQPPARLYPDLPQQPNFLPPFNGHNNHHQQHYPSHHGPTPFVPFGIQMPPNRLDDDRQPAPFGRVFTTPRPTTAAERLQSQSFADGLGRRLLSMIGIDTTPKSNETVSHRGEQQQQQQQQHTPGMMDETMKALQNSSVLQQLNRGVNSIYGGLSKMYNSTVQEQLSLLQERFRTETANSSNPWHQRMAQQVPQFFKQMTDKVTQAQEQLNTVWRNVNNGSVVTSRQGSPGGQSSFFNSPFIDQISSDVNGMFQPGGFFNQMGRSLGFNNDQQPQMMQGQPSQPGANGNTGQGQGQRDLMGQMREFWATQVQPQLGMVRNQAARVWRDLTTSGALTPEAIMRSRSSNNNNNLGSSSSPSGGTSELVDNILKEADMSNSEYTLIEPKIDGGSDGPNTNDQTNSNNNKPDQTPKLSPQMQNGLINVQRELNQVWMGLSTSLQNALNNVKRSLNPGPTFATMDAMASSQQPKRADPAENEIDGKIKNLSKLQRDTDMVYDALQQQQRETQQRLTFGDRFKSFFNNVDLSGMEQLPNRVGESVSRFGTVMGDLWNQVPERWDNFVTNMRPQQQPSQAEMMAKLKAGSSSSSTTPKTTE